MTTRSSTVAPILAALAIVLLMLAGYVGGYFWLGELSDWTSSEKGWRRVYSGRWQVAMYKPVGKLESWLRGEPVRVGYLNPTNDPGMPYEFLTP